MKNPTVSGATLRALSRKRQTCRELLVVGLALSFLGVAPSTGGAYIDQAPEGLTVPRLILEFRSIALLQVERLDFQRGAILFQHKEQIQGPVPFTKAGHVIRLSGSVPEEFKNVKPGDSAIFFSGDG